MIGAVDLDEGLTQRLCDKYMPLMTPSEVADWHDTARNAGTYLAVAGLLKRGLERGDLDVRDATSALEVAHAGKFRQLSRYLADQLQGYLNNHATV